MLCWIATILYTRDMLWLSFHGPPGEVSMKAATWFWLLLFDRTMQSMMDVQLGKKSSALHWKLHHEKDVPLHIGGALLTQFGAPREPPDGRESIRTPFVRAMRHLVASRSNCNCSFSFIHSLYVRQKKRTYANSVFVLDMKSMCVESSPASLSPDVTLKSTRG